MRVPYPNQDLHPQAVANTFPAQLRKAFTPGCDKRLVAFLQRGRDSEMALLINRRLNDMEQSELGAKGLRNRAGEIQGVQGTIGKVNRDKDLLHSGSGVAEQSIGVERGMQFR
jgi:hypothetical protein